MCVVNDVDDCGALEKHSSRVFLKYQQCSSCGPWLFHLKGSYVTLTYIYTLLKATFSCGKGYSYTHDTPYGIE